MLLPLFTAPQTLGRTAFHDMSQALQSRADEEEEYEAQNLDRRSKRHEASDNLAALSRQRRTADDVYHAVSKPSSKRVQEGFTKEYCDTVVTTAKTVRDKADKTFFAAQKDRYKTHGEFVGRASFLSHQAKSEAAWNKSEDKKNYDDMVMSEANSYFESPKG
jgi:hypothetical protein